MTTLQPISVLVSHGAPISRIAMDPSESRLVTADTQRDVCFWKRTKDGWTKTVDLSFRHPNDKYRALDHVRAVEFSPDGKWVYIASGEGLYLYDFDEGTLLAERDTKPMFAFLINTVQDVAVRQDGLVALSSSDGSVDLMPPDLSYPLKFKDREGPVMIGFNGAGELVGSDHYHLVKWDGATGKRVPLTEGTSRTRLIFDEKVFDLAVHVSKPLVAIRTLGEVSLLDTNRLELVASAAVGVGLPRIAWSHDGQGLASLEHERVVMYSLSLEILHSMELDADSHPVGLRAIKGGWLVGLSDGNLVEWRRG